jgi:periplasmic nitrate reductase NapD
MSKSATPSRRDLLKGLHVDSLHADGPQIAGLVVHVRPHALGRVMADLRAMPGVEIHGESAVGKIVLTLETDDSQIVQRMGAIGDLPGVLSTALAWHGSV